MKLLKTVILALSLTVTATVGLAADYEIFAEFATVETGVNHYSVERLDHKNKKLYHCTAVLDAKTKQLTGQCTERPDFPEKTTGKGSERAGRDFKQVWRSASVRLFGKSTRLPGKLNSISDPAQCVEVTPQ